MPQPSAVQQTSWPRSSQAMSPISTSRRTNSRPSSLAFIKHFGIWESPRRRLRRVSLPYRSDGQFNESMSCALSAGFAARRSAAASGRGTASRPTNTAPVGPSRPITRWSRRPTRSSDRRRQRLLVLVGTESLTVYRLPRLKWGSIRHLSPRCRCGDGGAGEHRRRRRRNRRRVGHFEPAGAASRQGPSPHSACRGHLARRQVGTRKPSGWQT